MAGISPFTSGTTPLKNAPYYSRLADVSLVNTDSVVNYPLIAFKPGYALQASELNEIQENFYVQKTLSDNLYQNWWKIASNIEMTGSASESRYGPGWEGAIPLTPQTFTLLDNQVFFTFSSSLARQWFLITDPNTKFKFWIAVNLSTTTESFFFRQSLPAISYFGIKIDSSFVNCSGTEGEPGYIFNDNSTGNYIQNTCGASRLKIALKTTGGFTSQTSLTTDFLPILKIRKNSDIPSQNSILIQYMNNYLFHKESI
jgi:hypothetical protein